MSNKVRRLSEEAVRQIAAGEVIERPASVVKELLENSLDAGSARVVLEIEEGGRRLIRVSDDGYGMAGEDAKLALESHTTSKIRSFSDLDQLSTFGFRGEALPSIAAVSKMTLTTRPQDFDSAVQIKIEGSKILETGECARAQGTTVEVLDLFFNLPARLKFMRSEASEKSRIFKIFEEIAAAHPETAFELRSEGKSVQDLPPRTDGLERVRELWDGEFAAGALLPLSFNHPNLSITGWVSNPSEHRPTKNYQMVFVNRRPIASRFIHHALYEAYRDCLPVGRHPAAVLFFDLNPSQVDVNAHPSKREVKFRNEGQIYDCLVKEIRLKRSALSAPPRAMETPSDSLPLRDNGARSRPEVAEVQTATQTLVQTAFQTQTKALCQFDALYIVAEREGGLLIVDQHAASERVVYERLLDSYKSEGQLPSQPLLIPHLWNVSLPQAELLRERLSALEKLGMILEEFGERTFRLTEAPAGIPEENLQSVLDEILKSLEEEKDPQIFEERQIIRTACHSAVRAGDRLSKPELDKILEELAHSQNPHTCPHGRPTTLTLSRSELEKKFGRNY